MNFIELKEFQNSAINQLLQLSNTKNGEMIVMQSPTGSGKTIILCEFIKKYYEQNDKKVSFIWFCPGDGELEEQSKNKFENINPELTSKTLDEALQLGINEQDTIFINWDKLNKKDSKALREQEKKNLLDRIKESENNNIDFILIIDEAHKSFTEKTTKIKNLFGKNTTQIYVSATIDKKVMPEIDIEITEDDVIREGLITKFININEGIKEIKEFNTEEDLLLIDLAIAKQQEIKREYRRRGININPLILIQHPNNNSSDKSEIEKEENQVTIRINEINQYINEKYKYNYENKSIGCWLSNNKINVNKEENQPEPETFILHIKQAIATGWDCPRAKILVKLRKHSGNETFELQVIGRIRRMPEQKHYDEMLLDSCYLYTFDNEYKNGIIQTYNGKETKIVYLKDEYTHLNLGIDKEYKNENKDKPDSKKIKETILRYMIDKYKLEEVTQKNNNIENYINNIKKLEKLTEERDGYDFSKEIKISTIEGQFTESKELLSQESNIILKQKLPNKKELKTKFDSACYNLKSSLHIEETDLRAILRALFLKKSTKQRKYKRNPIGRLCNLSEDDFKIFVYNNVQQIKEDFRKAMFSNGQQLSLDFSTIEKRPFSIPYKDIVHYDGNRVGNEMRHNVYKNYTNNIIKSKPEQKFEEYCENNPNVQWLYKNGDKGYNYFSILYTDDTQKEYLFFPDYLVMINNKLHIIEIKGGEDENKASINIDTLKANYKLESLKRYVNEHNKTPNKEEIAWCFVRNKIIEKPTGERIVELKYSNTEWSEDLREDIWKPIEELF